MSPDQVLSRKHAEHARRNRDMEIDPALGLQAENFMLRLEKGRQKQKQPGRCATCGKKISAARLRAVPETGWCRKCSDKYERERGLAWQRTRK